MQPRKPLNFIDILQSDEKIKANLSNPSYREDSLFSRIFNNIKIQTGPLAKLAQAFFRANNDFSESEAWFNVLLAIISDDLLDNKGLLKKEIIETLKEIIGEDNWREISKGHSRKKVTQGIITSYVLEFVCGEVLTFLGADIKENNKKVTILNEAAKKAMIARFEKLVKDVSTNKRKDLEFLFINSSPATVLELIEEWKKSPEDNLFNLLFMLCNRVEVFSEINQKLMLPKDQFIDALRTSNNLLLKSYKDNCKTQILNDLIQNHLEHIDPETCLRRIEPQKEPSDLKETVSESSMKERLFRAEEAVGEAHLVLRAQAQKTESDHKRFIQEAKQTIENNKAEIERLCRALEVADEKARAQEKVYEDLFNKNQAEILNRSRLQVSIETLSKEKELAEAARQKATTDSREALRQIDDLQAQNETLLKGLEEQAAALATANRDLRDTTTSKNSEIEKLKARKRELETVVEESNTKLNKLRSEVSDLTAKASLLDNTLSSTLTEHEEERRLLTDRLEILKQALQKSIVDVETRIAEEVAAAEAAKDMEKKSAIETIQAEHTRDKQEQEEVIQRMLSDEKRLKQELQNQQAGFDAQLKQKEEAAAKQRQRIVEASNFRYVEDRKEKERLQKEIQDLKRFAGTRSVIQPPDNSDVPAKASDADLQPVYLEIYDFLTEKAIDNLTAWKEHLFATIQREIPRARIETTEDYEARLLNPRTRHNTKVSYSAKKAYEKYDICNNLIKTLNVTKNAEWEAMPDLEKVRVYEDKVAMAEKYYQPNEKRLDKSRTHVAIRFLYALAFPVTFFASLFWSPDNLLFLNNKSKENTQTKSSLNGLFGTRNAIKEEKLSFRTGDQLGALKARVAVEHLAYQNSKPPRIR